ncbi:MAG: MlaD family protein [Vicinamibacteria bacterium]|nr:MlaD family protein [Vicinamibacteria bacterium]
MGEVVVASEEAARNARSTRVGIFTLVGLLLMVLVLGAVTGGSWFEDRRRFVVFFPNPVGLREGAPVTFRQTALGEVASVDLVFTGRGVESEVQVVIAIRRGVLHGLGGEPVSRLTDDELAARLSGLGLRATVRATSPLAGQKYLDLDFDPSVPPRFAGIKDLPWPEIPSAPTDLELIREKVEGAIGKIADVPLDKVLLQMQTTLASAQRLLDAGEIEKAMREMRSSLVASQQLMGRAEKTLERFDGVADRIGVTLASADVTMQNLQATMTRLDRTLATVDRNVERTANTQHEALRNLDEMNELLRALRQLAEALQQHPEALLRGKPVKEDKR